ncbi:MAG TPA: tRNA (adenosine(37)-N6)-threonylcarbamoyltransferase complex ATPase subunit type 1 TsaE [Sedimentisphaerales bacterium]|nr:tRNA (adenosine(37)-N6)-threonylcarbamoyltransferase complex ATPase subunit type 1 TsaE [Sedimentisphaerales bacterium]
MKTIERISRSAEETIALGRHLGGHLRGGEVIGLVGPLGSGKTHFIKGIAAGCGAQDISVVTSPTFVLVNEYDGGRFEIYHIDAYRLENVGDFEMLGFDDFCHAGSVVLVEWADKVEPVLSQMQHITITLVHAGMDSRTIQLEGLPSYISL